MIVLLFQHKLMFVKKHPRIYKITTKPNYNFSAVPASLSQDYTAQIGLKDPESMSLIVQPKRQCCECVDHHISWDRDRVHNSLRILLNLSVL